MAGDYKFREVIRPGTNFEFVGRSRRYINLSLALMVASIAMLFLNAYVIPGRGRALNWGVDFRGGTEIVVNFAQETPAGDVRAALTAGGFESPDVVRYGEAGQGDRARSYMVRLGAVSVVSAAQAEKARASLAKVGEAALKSFEWSDGGDKVYVRFDRELDVDELKTALSGAGIEATQVQRFGRPEEHSFEVALIGLESEVRKALEAKLGAGSVAEIPQVSSVGAKAGEQLRNDGIKALMGVLLLICIYVAFRFDFRYGPGAVVALLHDAIAVIGAFAFTYREFSLTTLAAVLTIVGFSVNDTIVVFDRIRENASKFRDRKFDRVVNQSVNETLSRTILTSATVFFVTLAMNVFGTGVIKDFAFAMNVGVIVGTYSSIFVASPVLIWLNEKFVQAQRKAAARPERQRRLSRRDEDEPDDRPSRRDREEPVEA